MVETIVKRETRYNILSNIDLKKMVCLGFMNPSLLTWKTVYERYKIELENNRVGVAKQFVADEYGISYRMVSNIIKFMEE